jgi:hypothetical protein
MRLPRENTAASFQGRKVAKTKGVLVMTKPKRITIGVRCRFKTLKELPSRNGKKEFFANEDSWRRDYGGQHVLLKERSRGEFAVMLIDKKFTNERILPKETDGVIEDVMAWVPESDLVFVNADLDSNLDFMDWYEENEDL